MPSLGLLALTGWMIVERPKAFIPTEDQGYLIVVVQTPDGTSRRADQPGRPARRGRSPGSCTASRDVLDPRRLTSSPRPTRPTPASSFVILEDWHERRTAPELRAAGLAAELQGRLSDEIRDARGAGPPAAADPGLSQTGGFDFMIEDREGKGVEALPAVADRFLDEARKRPELAGVFTTFSARVPQLRFDVDRIKARRLDVPVSDVFSRPPDQPRRPTTSTTSTSTARPGRSWSRPRAAIAHQARGHRRPLRPEPQGGAGAAQLPGRGQVRARADRRAALQPLHRRQDHRPARPGLQLGPGDRRDAGGRRRGPARGVRLRVDRHDLPGAEDRQPWRPTSSPCRSSASSCSWRPSTRAGSGRWSSS